MSFPSAVVKNMSERSVLPEYIVPPLTFVAKTEEIIFRLRLMFKDDVNYQNIINQVEEMIAPFKKKRLI